MSQIINSKYDEVKIYAKTIEDEAIAQIIAMSNSPVGKDAHIRIMPDAHAGKGCTIGTTMYIVDKVCPNLVGVDIGCGVLLAQTNINFKERFNELDEIIRKYVPYGTAVNGTYCDFNFGLLHCWDKLSDEVKHRAKLSMGTLGGGNHFIEIYENGWLAVHSGSRNIGLAVAKHYQDLAVQKCSERMTALKMEMLNEIAPESREKWLREKVNEFKCDKELAYLMGQDMEDYLWDVDVLQVFANYNRFNIINKIIKHMNGNIIQKNIIHSIHNYIDIENKILRKGAISAQAGERLVIPLNMRDGILICEGKGNEDWNYSAPHGAGRLYSRSEAKSAFTVDEYAHEMEGIYSSCINENTLDEAPFVYKDYKEIMECIEPTVNIVERLVPIYNFKADK